MYGDGQMKRDYTYIEDIVDGLHATLSARFGMETLNLGSASPVSLTDLIEGVSNACGQSPRILKASGSTRRRGGHVRRHREGRRHPGIPAEGGPRGGPGPSVEWFRRQAGSEP